MAKERILHADIVRIVTCLMVVLMHSPMPGPKLIPIFTSGLTYFTMPCIGLFLTLSGYLLLPVKKSPSESVTFAISRVKKFIWPTIIWSLIYMIVNGTFSSGDMMLIVRKLCSIPFYPQEGVLWYMYVLVGLYFVAPIISPWLEQINKKTIQIYLFIWGITLLIPFLRPFVSIRTGESNILYYFSGYLGYFVLGFYLRKYDIKINPFKAIIGILVCMVLYAGFQIYIADSSLNFGEVFWYLSIDSPVLLLCWWNILRVISDLIKNSQSKLKNLVVNFSYLSFGVYLAHLLVMRYGLWQIEWIQNIENYIVQTLLVFFLTLFFTNVLVYFISKLPVGNYIIAYKK